MAVAAVFAASSALAVLPPVGYIGLFTDAAHYDNTVCPGVYVQFPCWIMCLPSVHGLQAAEFGISFPPTAIVLATVQNPLTARLCCGALPTGVSVSFGEGMCQMDWVWLYQLTMMSLAASPGKIEIVPHPDVRPLPAYQFASCELGYPIEPCINLTPLYICWSPDPGPLGVREASWGAIKSLF
jgi:hypothetical protein